VAVFGPSGFELDLRSNGSSRPTRRRLWQGAQAYADTKLYDVLLAFAVARSVS
jgi:hypothetical protein